MTRSTRAGLLSAFVFPGAGHVYLKKYVPGFILIVVTFMAAFVVVSNATEQALSVTEKIQKKGGQIDIGAISRMMEGADRSEGSAFSSFASTTLFVCWLVGIIDAVRIGNKQEKEHK